MSTRTRTKGQSARRKGSPSGSKFAKGSMDYSEKSRIKGRREDRSLETGGRDDAKKDKIGRRGAARFERDRQSGRGRSVRSERTKLPEQTRVEEVDKHEEFVFGRRAVLEALKGQRALNKILLQEDAAGGSLTEILAVARDQRVIVQKVPKAKMNEIVGERSHQGVIAYTSAKNYVDLEELIQKARAKKPGLLVVLDGIEDPHNLGSILRVADGAGAAGVIIPKRRAVALTGTVAKASAGALEHVDVARVSNIGQTLLRLKEAGFWVIGTSPEAPQMYWQVDYTMPVAVVIGAEGAGISRLTAERCDVLVGLPMNGQVNSLNAGVATGILLYEIVRQRISRLSK